MQTLTIDIIHGEIVTPEQLDALEHDFNLSLPIALRKFLIAYGGTTTHECFFYVKPSRPAKVEYFMPVLSNKNMLTIRGILQFNIDQYGSNEYIPFASCGSKILHLKITGTETDPIYFTHGGSDYDDPFEKFYAFTFESLINSLTARDLSEQLG